MRIVKWIGAAIVTVAVVLLLLDTFGGYLFDGPLGPIPGGRLSGPTNRDKNPDWSHVEKVIQIEIRPSKPWSLNVWAVDVDASSTRLPLREPAAAGRRSRLRTRGCACVRMARSTSERSSTSPIRS